jgi:hypothetical protein
MLKSNSPLKLMIVVEEQDIQEDAVQKRCCEISIKSTIEFLQTQGLKDLESKEPIKEKAESPVEYSSIIKGKYSNNKSFYHKSRIIFGDNFIALSSMGPDEKAVDKALKAVLKDFKLVEASNSDDKDDEGQKTFVEKGKFSVEVPEKGFRWKKFQDIDINKEKLIGTSYLCTNKHSRNSVFLSYLKQNAKSDQDKRNFIAGNYDGFKGSFEKGNGKIIEEVLPDLKANIPDQVSYSLKLQNPDKSEFYQYITIFFGKNTFSITAQSLKLNEAKALNEKTVKSLKEIDE